MKMNFRSAKNRGYALIMVIFFSGLSLTLLGSALQWTSTTSRLTERNNRIFQASAAAEAATEKILTAMSKDYQSSGEGVVYNNLSTYATYYPTSSESSYWTNFAFSDAQGNASKTYISRTVAWQYSALESQYQGLFGMASTYRIVSNAKTKDLALPITAGVKQEVQVASIPIFQFAIFYSMDLEINPGPNMNITGRVHSNAEIYTQPQAILNYQSHVTAASKINIGKSPLDPTSRTPGTVNFQAEHDGGVSSLTLPIGTNNTPAAVRAVVEVPPGTESASSLMGQQRYYNKSDIIILVSNTTVTAKLGSFDNFATTIPSNQVAYFLNTNVNFYSKREGKTIKTTQLDVAKFKDWSSSNNVYRALKNKDVSSVYIGDFRSQTGTTESGVRLVNGSLLPTLGLTVATPNPAYIQGHYNSPLATRGTTNTAGTLPASVVADAITILSSAWSDANASSSLSSRQAANTTVNAAFLAGIVPSNGTSYSGGVENFPRFLEDWAGDTFTYNGSMVVMFPSQIATAPWGGSDVYAAPNRNWTFDLNFMDATKLPPGTPQLLTIIRSKWAMVAPDNVN
jgi:hypothetical protein